MPTQSSRRRFLMQVAALTAVGSSAASQEKQPEASLTGNHVPELEPFDRLLQEFIGNKRTPGISLAIARRGKLIYARGAGLADREKSLAVQPDSLFRIASVSKPLTAVAVMQLVEQNKLELDELVFPRLQLEPIGDATFDERWRKITIRQCLQHTGGWDREASFDPIGRPRIIARALGVEPTVTPEQIVRYMLGQPLDFDPGERYAYSNLGYLVLGRLIERASGQKYEDYLRQKLLAPLGIKRMQLGRALREHQAEGEVCYYDSQDRTGKCLYPPHRNEPVPICYGAENFEGYEAHGGWIASAADLVKFAVAVDNLDRSPLLKRKTIETMWARSEGAAGKNKQGEPADSYYGCGWSVRPVGERGECNAWHTGYIAGSEALLVRRWDGLVWAALFNTAGDRKKETLVGRIDSLLHRAAAEVKHWPA